MNITGKRYPPDAQKPMLFLKNKAMNIIKKTIVKMKRKKDRESMEALIFDRDSIYFRPYIKTVMPKNRLSFNATFKYLRKIQKKMWDDEMANRINLNNLE